MINMVTLKNNLIIGWFNGIIYLCAERKFLNEKKVAN